MSSSPQNRLAEDARTMLEALVQGFDRDAIENREHIRSPLDGDRQACFSDTIEILRTGDDSRGAQYLVALLVANGLLLPALCDPVLTREQALSLARGCPCGFGGRRQAGEAAG